jgi:hypothetical protein
VVTEAGQFGGEALFIEGERWLGGEALFIEGERWFDGGQWWAGATMAAAIVIRPINIVARAATMVAEPIEGAQFIEGAQWLDGEARFIEAELPIVVDAVLPIVAVDGDGNTTDRVPRNGIRPIRWSWSSKTRRRMSERAWVKYECAGRQLELPTGVWRDLSNRTVLHGACQAGSGHRPDPSQHKRAQ